MPQNTKTQSKADKKPISVASRKAKGRALQQWTAKKIAELLGVNWGYDEVVAPREMGQSGVDIRLVADAQEQFPWSVECKWVERLNLYEAVKQAKANQKMGTDWLLVAKKNRSDPLIIIDADVFFDLLRLLKGKKGR